MARMQRGGKRGRDGIREVMEAGHVGPYITTLSFTLIEMEPGESRAGSRPDSGIHRVPLAVYGQQAGS